MSTSRRVDIIEDVLASIPEEVEVVRVDYEGPRLAIYAKRPEILIEQSFIISDIVSRLHKRIIIRSDPSVRVKEGDAIKIINKIVPPEANIKNISFDHNTGEVIIEAEKPGLVIGKNWSNPQRILKETKWRVRALRAPSIPSRTIEQIRSYLYSQTEEREKFLRSAGERIFRQAVFKDGEVRITCLGGFQEVGRSAILLQTRESSILLDCGINAGSTSPQESFPRLDVNEFDLDQLEAVIITHAHLDHCGFLPFLYKYGYEGPTYCSEPTFSLMTLLQLDYLDVLASKGLPLLYDQKDVRKVMSHTIPLSYGDVTDISPDVKITLHNAGHILGSSIAHLHIGEGFYNIVYTGDYKFMPTMLLEPAVSRFPRVELLITETTYGGNNDVMPPRNVTEETLVSIVNETIDGGGKVLIPVLAVGRSQEIMSVLDKYMREGRIREVPIYIEGMVSEVTAIHTVYPEYLSRDLCNKILHQGIDPFRSEYFVTVKSPDERPPIIEGGPSIILATSGMLEGGPVLEYFKGLAEDDKNTMILVSYQVEGTLGRRIQHGLDEVPIVDESGKMRMIKVRMKTRVIEGFSGHSDRSQILAYLSHVSPRPQRIMLCHGERSKCASIMDVIRKMLRLNICAPANLESIRLR